MSARAALLRALRALTAPTSSAPRRARAPWLQRAARALHGGGACSAPPPRASDDEDSTPAHAPAPECAWLDDWATMVLQTSPRVRARAEKAAAARSRGRGPHPGAGKGFSAAPGHAAPASVRAAPRVSHARGARARSRGARGRAAAACTRGAPRSVHALRAPCDALLLCTSKKPSLSLTRRRAGCPPARARAG
jgi:hypothetical protein